MSDIDEMSSTIPGTQQVLLYFFFQSRPDIQGWIIKNFHAIFVKIALHPSESKLLDAFNSIYFC